MLRRLASASYEHRRLTVLVWITVLVGAVALNVSVGSTFSQGSSLPGTESKQAADLLQARFPAEAGDEGQIVVADRHGVRSATTRTPLTTLLARVARTPGVTGIVSPYDPAGAGQISRDGTVAYASVQFAAHTHEIRAATLDAIRALAGTARESTPGLRVALGGPMFEENTALGPAEFIGLFAAIVILLVSFGSVLAMGLPIITALFGVGVGVSLVAVGSQVFTTPDFATQLAAMIGIGVGIDYALFIVTRYRSGLADGLDPATAVARAIDTAGRAVVFAGCTVVISMLGLFLMGVSFVNGLAVGTSMTVGVVMLASITLLPAVLGFVGRNIDRLAVHGRAGAPSAQRRSLWFRWSRVVQRRPWPTLIGALLVLVVCALPLFSMRLAFPDAGSRPVSDTTRQAYDLITHGFGAGFSGPLVLAAEYPRGAGTAELDRLVTGVKSTPDVVAVSSPTLNATGDAAVVRVTPASSPQSEATADLVARLRDRVIPRALRGSDVRVYIGGLTASSVDVSRRLSDRLPFFIGAVLVLSFLLLMVVFRSVLVPLKAVAMNLLSIGAAYGVVVAVFQWGWFGDVVGVDKTGPIVPYLPMMMFAILFGLSMDYEVFLLSTIKEEYDRTGDNAVAVADGLASTARVITAAALIMVTVFGSFVFAGTTAIKLFGVGLATAILVDATLVRLVLVPATMELLGDRNWWLPRWLDRLLPRLDVESAKPLPSSRALPGQDRE